MSTSETRRGFLRVVGGALAGAAVLGAAATSESEAVSAPEVPTLPDTTSPRIIEFPPGEATSGTDIPRLVGEAGRLHPGAKHHGLEVIWQVDTSKKLVALTFDDGPVPGVSNALYDTLDELKIPATFFMVGKRVLANAKLLDGRMARHEIGNHTYSHESTFTKTDGEILQDISYAHRAIVDVLDKEPRLFRPPYSHVNGATLVAAAAMGYDLAMWSGNIGYTGYEGDGERLVREVVETVTPGSIVLCHDGGPEYLISISAVPNIVRDLKAQGYEFVTISDMRAAGAA